MNTLGMKRSDPIASNAHVCIGKLPEATTRNETKRNETKRERGEDATIPTSACGYCTTNNNAAWRL